MESLTRIYPLALDRFGHPIDIMEHQAGFLVRRFSGGKRGVEYHNGLPLIVPLTTTRRQLIDKVEKPGVFYLSAVTEDEEEIPGAPIAMVELTPEETGHNFDGPQWMRLDRVFDALDRSLSAMESKDMIFGQIAKALLENNTELQSGAVRLLDTANMTINVANGIERPDLDVDHIIDQVVDGVSSSKSEPAHKAPWFVQLLNGTFGQTLLNIAQGVTGRKDR